jgi:hypothetical protein
VWARGSETPVLTLRSIVMSLAITMRWTSLSLLLTTSLLVLQLRTVLLPLIGRSTLKTWLVLTSASES